MGDIGEVGGTTCRGAHKDRQEGVVHRPSDQLINYGTSLAGATSRVGDILTDVDQCENVCVCSAVELQILN